MLRRPSSLASAASLVLCVAVGALWVRSYAPQTILVESRPGQLLLVGVDAVHKTVREDRDGKSLENFLGDYFRWNPPREQYLAGFYLARGAAGTRSVSSGETYTLNPYWVVGVPYWALMLLALALPAWQAVRRRAAARRARANGCAVCGYDLRATPDRCPECGTVPGGTTGGRVKPEGGQ